MHSVAIFHLGGVGGPSRSLLGAMSLLAECGTVEVIVPESGATQAEYSRFGPATVGDYSALTYVRGVGRRANAVRGFARDVRYFRGEFRRRNPDLVVLVTTVLPTALLAARLEGIPCVVYAAELYRQVWKGDPQLRLWGKLLAAATASLADGIVCCSETVAEQFPRRRAPVAVAYPPIGERYATGDRERGRRRYGIADDALCLAVVGNLSRGRGHDVALRALALLRERYPGIRLLVVGAPHPRELDIAFVGELHALARDLGIEDNVVFAEPTDTVEDVYAAANVVLNPARYDEPFGRVAAEALVAGRPVVTSRVGGIPEALREELDALFVEPEDHDAFAAAVIRLVEDPDLADRLVANGRERVRSEFGEDQDLAAWRRILAGAASEWREVPVLARRPEHERVESAREQQEEQPR